MLSGSAALFVWILFSPFSTCLPNGWTYSSLSEANSFSCLWRNNCLDQNFSLRSHFFNLQGGEDRGNNPRRDAKSISCPYLMSNSLKARSVKFRWKQYWLRKNPWWRALFEISNCTRLTLIACRNPMTTSIPWPTSFLQNATSAKSLDVALSVWCIIKLCRRRSTSATPPWYRESLWMFLKWILLILSFLSQQCW